MKKYYSIGLTDSGIGGLTVARLIQQYLPHENIAYFGDNRNCPYGSKSSEQLIELASWMISTLSRNGLKLTAVACNTTASIIDQFAPRFPFPVLSVIDPVAQAVAKQSLSSIGVIATPFTIQSGSYQKRIHLYNSNIEVCPIASPQLAALVDSGNLESDELILEIKTHMDILLAEHPDLKHVILGCTHYPIVTHVFERLYPEITFIDPAVEQVKKVAEYLQEQDLQNDTENPTFQIYTTGDPELYIRMCERLGMKQPDKIHQL